jgi:hypothetical protein
LERGVLAELEGNPNSALFKQALVKFQECSAHMSTLDQKLGELIALHRRSQPDQLFDQTTRKILNQQRPVERVSLRGLRYANVARGRGAPQQPQPRHLLEVMEMQQADLRLLKRQMDDTIAAFRAVIPLAERHEFAALILSGRHGFADKIQQSVHLTQVYANSYIQKCSATIDATMQIYPSGLGWLKDSQKRGAAVPPRPFSSNGHHWPLWLGLAIALSPAVTVR